MDLATVVVLTTSIVEVIKKLNKCSKELMPFLAMVVGIAMTFLYSPELPINEIFVWGIISGLTATGFYESGKSVLKLGNAKEMWTKLLSKK